LEKAERDTLTKLYNKGTAQSLIQQHLEMHPNSLSALMIVDIDNFKQINDRLGHLFGDAFLSEAAERIQRLFRSSDIIGRIGGDEFIVLMRDIGSKKLALHKAEEIIRAFGEIRTGGLEEIHVSCSVGIAFWPGDGQNFADLYGTPTRRCTTPKTWVKTAAVSISSAGTVDAAAYGCGGKLD
jgi:diguanylate cyclase (GGDEF)-like protein